jgi:hypothetical protein
MRIEKMILISSFRTSTAISADVSAIYLNSYKKEERFCFVIAAQRYFTGNVWE